MSRPSRANNRIVCRHCGRAYRAITAGHLRHRHGYAGEHPVYDYLRRFDLQKSVCVDLSRQFRSNAHTIWDRRGRDWSPAKVIGAIRRLHRKGPKLRKKLVPARLHTAGQNYFGSWKAALAKAGLDYEEATGARFWTPEKVIEAIQKLAQAGARLDFTHVRRHRGALYAAAELRFDGKWHNALRAAGLNPADYRLRRGRWTTAKAAAWVKRRIAQGRSLLSLDAPQDLLKFVRVNYHKGWIAFVESFGIPYPGIKKRRNYWTRDIVLEEVRRWNEAGHPTNYSAMEREYYALVKQGVKLFGTWDAARAAAGVKVERLR